MTSGLLDLSGTLTFLGDDLSQDTPAARLAHVRRSLCGVWPTNGLPTGIKDVEVLPHANGDLRLRLHLDVPVFVTEELWKTYGEHVGTALESWCMDGPPTELTDLLNNASWAFWGNPDVRWSAA